MFQMSLANPEDPAEKMDFEVNRWLDAGQDDCDVMRECAANYPDGDDEPLPS